MQNSKSFLVLFTALLLLPWTVHAKSNIVSEHFTLPLESHALINTYFDLDRNKWSITDVSGWQCQMATSTVTDLNNDNKINDTDFNKAFKKACPWQIGRAYDGHKGIDFHTKTGTYVVAAASGEVISVTSSWKDNEFSTRSYGNLIVIQQADGSNTYYGHLQAQGITEIGLKAGDHVKRGDRIAKSDNNGFSDGSHLHFEIRKKEGKNWVPVDPFSENLWITDGTPNVTTAAHILTALEYEKQLAKPTPSVQSQKVTPTTLSSSPPSLKSSSWFFNLLGWFPSVWHNTKSWFVSLLGPPAQAQNLPVGELFTSMDRASSGEIGTPKGFVFYVPAPSKVISVALVKNSPSINKNQPKPAGLIPQPVSVPSPTISDISSPSPIAPSPSIVPTSPVWQDPPPVIASGGGGGGHSSVIPSSVITVTSSTLISTPSEATSTPSSPHVAFTLFRPIPDTRFVELEWMATGVATGTPRFSLQYSADQGGTWIDIFQDTTSSQLIWEAPPDVARPILRIGVIETNGQTNSFVTSSAITFVRYPKQVVINELAPQGTNNHPEDEWIELMNTTGKPIDVTGWTLSNESGTFSVNLMGKIKPYNYFLLEQGDENTLANVTSNQIYVGRLDDHGEDLFLKNPQGQIIDRVDWSRGWPTPGASAGFSIMRTSFSESGSWFMNWSDTYDGFVAYAKDRDTNLIQGSPARVNHKPVRLEGTIVRSTNLTAEAGPYEIGDVTLAQGVTLTVLPGTVLRLLPVRQGKVTISRGTRLEAKGSDLRPIIFTSWYDDEYGGVLPGQGEEKPSRGDWQKIIFERGADASLIDHAVIRYGGSRCRLPLSIFDLDRTCHEFDDTVISIASDPVQISNNIIEEFVLDGIQIRDAKPLLQGNNLRSNKLGPSDIGILWYANFSLIHVKGGSPMIEGNTIEGGVYGVAAESGAVPTIKNNILRGSMITPIKFYNSIASLEGNQLESQGMSQAIFIGGALPRDFSLDPSIYWILDQSDLEVPRGITLTIPAGTKIFSSYQGVMVKGRLLAEGTTNAPVFFTSWFDEELLPKNSIPRSALTIGPSNWAGMSFQGTGELSLLRHVTIRSAGFTQALLVKDSKGTGGTPALRLENVDISTAPFPASSVLLAENSSVTITTSAFRNADYGIKVIGASTVMIEQSKSYSHKVGISSAAEATTLLSNMTAADFVDVQVPTDPADLLASSTTTSPTPAIPSDNIAPTTTGSVLPSSDSTSTPNVPALSTTSSTEPTPTFTDSSSTATSSTAMT